jgi:hypothetical protein
MMRVSAENRSKRMGIFERGNAALVGVTLNISRLAVFCTPIFESPDGSDGRYFAMGRGAVGGGK